MGAECVSDAKGIFDGPQRRRRARSAGRLQQETRGVSLAGVGQGWGSPADSQTPSVRSGRERQGA